MSYSEIGSISEIATQKKLVELGYEVSIPISQYQYDLVARIDDNMVRVQVKTARKRTDRNGVIKTDFAKNKSKDYTYYDGTDVDAFATYYPENGEVYWMWFDDAPKSGFSRTEESLKSNKIENQL